MSILTFLFTFSLLTQSTTQPAKAVESTDDVNWPAMYQPRMPDDAQQSASIVLAVDVGRLHDQMETGSAAIAAFATNTAVMDRAAATALQLDPAARQRCVVIKAHCPTWRITRIDVALRPFEGRAWTGDDAKKLISELVAGVRASMDESIAASGAAAAAQLKLIEARAAQQRADLQKLREEIRAVQTSMGDFGEQYDLAALTTNLKRQLSQQEKQRARQVEEFERNTASIREGEKRARDEVARAQQRVEELSKEASTTQPSASLRSELSAARRELTRAQTTLWSLEENTRSYPNDRQNAAIADQIAETRKQLDRLADPEFQATAARLPELRERENTLVNQMQVDAAQISELRIVANNKPIIQLTILDGVPDAR